MAQLYKNIPTLPDAGTMSVLYVVPPDKQAVVSSLWACNQGDEETVFRVAVVPSGESAPEASGQSRFYRYYNELVRGHRTFASTTGISLAEGDSIYVYTPTGQVSFSIDLVEIDLES